MDYRVTVLEKHVQVEAGGAFDPKMAGEVVARLFEACAASGLALALVDARGLDPGVGIGERMDLARAIAENRRGPVRIAILVDTAQMVTKTLENAAHDRGVPVRTTASVAEAYRFLGIGPPG
ncbi:MAG TPA: hypothetical protein PLK52_04670 [Usitatibacteraceae bacterium]|jgi:hypothetical protein|nr:hypothetical protein [Usitatibacteraceae bacterium]HQY48429.1 hypothetical protein [Usitatibacteraceae bacterium]HRA22828.1 hypothetical protein [Usitatibacteraceae bacterium]